jgi:hypothetical protein
MITKHVAQFNLGTPKGIQFFEKYIELQNIRIDKPKRNIHRSEFSKNRMRKSKS